MSFQGPSSVANHPETQETEPKDKKRKTNLWENKFMPSILSGAREHNEKLAKKLKAHTEATSTEPAANKELTQESPLPVTSPDSHLIAGPSVSSLRCEETLDLAEELESVISKLDDEKSQHKASPQKPQATPAALSPYSKAILNAKSQGVGASFAYRQAYKEQYTIEELNQRISACAEANKQWKNRRV